MFWGTKSDRFHCFVAPSIACWARQCLSRAPQVGSTRLSSLSPNAQRHAANIPRNQTPFIILYALKQQAGELNESKQRSQKNEGHFFHLGSSPARALCARHSADKARLLVSCGWKRRSKKGSACSNVLFELEEVIHRNKCWIANIWKLSAWFQKRRVNCYPSNDNFISCLHLWTSGALLQMRVSHNSDRCCNLHCFTPLADTLSENYTGEAHPYSQALICDRLVQHAYFRLPHRGEGTFRTTAYLWLPRRTSGALDCYHTDVALQL